MVAFELTRFDLIDRNANAAVDYAAARSKVLLSAPRQRHALHVTHQMSNEGLACKMAVCRSQADTWPVALRKRPAAVTLLMHANSAHAALF